MTVRFIKETFAKKSKGKKLISSEAKTIVELKNKREQCHSRISTSI